MDTAEYILEALTHELNLAMAAADPDELEGEYIAWMLEYTEGLVEFDDQANEFVWYEPKDAEQAARIQAAIAIIRDENDEEM